MPHVLEIITAVCSVLKWTVLYFECRDTYEVKFCVYVVHDELLLYRGADKSLARPGRKQATAIEDFEFHISYL